MRGDGAEGGTTLGGPGRKGRGAEHRREEGEALCVFAGWWAVSGRYKVSHFSLLKSHFPQSQPFPRATLSMSLCSARGAEGLAPRRAQYRAARPSPPSDSPLCPRSLEG